MSVTQSQENSFRWKWFGIAIIMYFVFYYLPLSIVMPGGLLNNSVVTNTSIKFHGAWAFAGIFIIATVLGFIAKDIMIKETVVAIICSYIIFLFANHIKLNHTLENNLTVIKIIFIGLGILLCMGIAGSWLGNQIQKRGKQINSAP